MQAMTVPLAVLAPEDNMWSGRNQYESQLGRASDYFYISFHFVFSPFKIIVGI